MFAIVYTFIFCNTRIIDKISDVEEYDIDKIEELYKEIFDELPVMRLHTDGSEIWLEYNKDTNIIFVDPKKSIRRDIILNNLFKDENYKWKSISELRKNYKINFKPFDRLYSIRKIYKIEIIPISFKGDDWFTNK